MEATKSVEIKRDRKKDKKDKRDKKEKREKRKERKEQKQSQQPEVSQPSKKRRRDSDPNGSSNKKQKTDESVDLSKLTTTDNDLITRFQENHNITVSGDITNFKPIEKFDEAPFSQDLLSVTKTFKQPTPIQAQCWPILLAKRDAIGIAETGSGKTLAYGLPGLMRMNRTSPSKKPTMLIIAPTRELAQQNHDVLAVAGKACGLQSVCVYGGVPKDAQRKAFREGVQLVVGCPGRLLDLANETSCDLSQVNYFVLDEADRMLDMGFEKDIRQIFSMVSKDRQTVMFSATWPKSIQQLASEFLSNPIRVTIGSEDLSANTKVKQIVEVIEMEQRDARLLELLTKYHKGQKEKVLVFALYKKEATRLEILLQRKGWKCTSIHGDKTSVARSEALESFKQSSPPLLIATDVAARGLDIPKVAYVINYSFPLTVEDYVHRIGRTGRAGATGISHTFFHKFDKAHSGELIGVLRKAGQDVPEDLMQFGTHVKKKEPKLGKIDINSTSSHITFDSDDEEDL
jgi:ATP-dependent RNA helicase DBP3